MFLWEANMQILLSFVGGRDPFAPNNDEKKAAGPLLSLLGKRKFEKLYIFYTNQEFWEKAQKVQEVCRKRQLGMEIEFREVAVYPPTDYEMLFKVMNNECQKILEANAKEKPAYFIGADSGTPQMQTIWFILAQSELIPATLLQGVPPKFGQGEYQVKEVNLSLDSFPQIVSPDAIRRELDIISAQRDALKAERDSLVGDYQFEGIIGKSLALRFVTDKAFRVAQTHETVLIRGESGTGKELFAKGIHYNSPRKDKSFIALNCSAITETIAESELFGHEKGAFTGADRQRKGSFELANGGTLFLDEIGDMPVSTQAKLLRVLQERELTRVGGSRKIKVDVRIIAATHQNLEQMIKTLQFRDDLYGRLRVIELKIPPLREHREDIPLLIQYFLDKLNGEYGAQKKLSRDVLKILLSYPWPRNVRELENSIRGMYVLSTGDELTADTLPNDILMAAFDAEKPLEVQIPADGFNLKRYLQKLEKAYYLKAIELSNDNRAKAARLLKMKEHAFRRRARDDFKI